MDGEVQVVGESAAPTNAKPARARRTVRIPVALPLRIVDALLVVPAVQAEIEMHRRLTVLQVMGGVVPCLLSTNQFAKAVGVPASSLSLWGKAFSTGGTEALRPKPWNGGKRPKTGVRAEHAAFLEFTTEADTDAAS